MISIKKFKELVEDDSVSNAFVGNVIRYHRSSIIQRLEDADEIVRRCLRNEKALARILSEKYKEKWMKDQ